MSFRSFLDIARKRFPSSVYFFFASDPFLCREALEAVRELVPVAERDFNLHEFDLSSQTEESSSFEQILNVVHTASFFGGRRYTVVTGNLQKIVKKDVEKLRSYAARPAPESVLILLHHGLLGKEAREKFKPLRPVCIDIGESDIPHWMHHKLQEMGIDISDEAIDFIMSLVGVDIGLLSAEIGKISCIGLKRIDVRDIADIVAGGRQYGAFDLVDALKARDARKVFTIYRSLQLTTDDYGLIGALNWQYARFARQGMSREESQYLASAFELLHQADIEIKSSGRNYPMEYLLVKLLKLQGLRSPSG